MMSSVVPRRSVPDAVVAAQRGFERARGVGADRAVEIGGAVRAAEGVDFAIGEVRRLVPPLVPRRARIGTRSE